MFCGLQNLTWCSFCLGLSTLWPNCLFLGGMNLSFKISLEVPDPKHEYNNIHTTPEEKGTNSMWVRVRHQFWIRHRWAEIFNSFPKIYGEIRDSETIPAASPDPLVETIRRRWAGSISFTDLPEQNKKKCNFFWMWSVTLLVQDPEMNSYHLQMQSG